MNIDKLKNKKLFLLIGLACIIIAVAVYINHDTANENSYIEASRINSMDLSIAQRKTLKSLQKIDDFPVYIMQYDGDYGFSDYLKEGKKVSKYINDGKKDYNACSCIAALNDKGDKIFGRNFDYFYSPKLLLFTSPSDGYASVSMVDLRHAGIVSEKALENPSIDTLKRLLDSPYIPMDGMNEYGLAIGEMTASGSEAAIDPNKITLGDVTAIRLALDHAKTVDEAISLLEKYNIYFPPAPPLHFMISDREGKSVIVEFIDGDMKVIPNENPWQVSTNFLVYDSSEATRNSCRRYSTAEKALKEKDGHMCEEEVMKLLEEISQSSTQWSIVYNMNKGNITLAINKKYDNPKHYNIKVK